MNWHSQGGRMNTKEHIKLMKRLIVLQYLKVKKVKRSQGHATR